MLRQRHATSPTATSKRLPSARLESGLGEVTADIQWQTAEQVGRAVPRETAQTGHQMELRELADAIVPLADEEPGIERQKWREAQKDPACGSKGIPPVGEVGTVRAFSRRKG